MRRIAVGVGGTFTDVFLVGDDGRLVAHKVPSTPRDPSIASDRGRPGNPIPTFVLSPKDSMVRMTDALDAVPLKDCAQADREGADCPGDGSVLPPYTQGLP
jgi:hypothetical protein